MGAAEAKAEVIEAMAQGYCVKCKASREIKDAKQITMKNGRPATEGTCPVCGTKIFKIGAAT
jgi:RNase P subunit RPR2